MDGEFRGDVTRDTFDPRHHFTRVLMQQGRVLLDADWNEQTAILLHYLHALGRAIIGPYGGTPDSFEILPDEPVSGAAAAFELWINKGIYYVDGLLCESDTVRPYSAQPDFRLGPNGEGKPVAGDHLAYLDVWERHVTAVEDPRLREVALGGPDVTTRAQVVWQVKLLKLDAPLANRAAAEALLLTGLTGPFSAVSAGVTMRARAIQGQPASHPCVIDAAARYRGVENQLYRVEVHRGGTAWDGAVGADGKPAAGVATFKWSRDNSSVLLPVDRVTKDGLHLTTFGPDDRRGLQEHAWIELIDPRAVSAPAGTLWQIATIDRDEMSITVKPQAGVALPPQGDANLLVRRWDHRGTQSAPMSQGALVLTERDGEDDALWIGLEDGVQIQFGPGAGHIYRAGDYWLVPARTATGDVLWEVEREADGDPVLYPSGTPKPEPRPPHGIAHHYAPLAGLTFDGAGAISGQQEFRRTIAPIAT
jgi:hypothetical protein